MKDSINPFAFWGIVGVVLVALVGVFVLRNQSGYNAKTEPDNFGKRVLEGQPVYVAPPGAPGTVPNAGGAASPGGAYPGGPGMPPGPPGASTTPPGPPGMPGALPPPPAMPAAH